MHDTNLPPERHRGAARLGRHTGIAYVVGILAVVALLVFVVFSDGTSDVSNDNGEANIPLDGASDAVNNAAEAIDNTVDGAVDGN
ncbi:hypothetical protein [Puniceibacterium sp. IMCC21224]|uniref:hypothetical protein n=1 Tax=Puniceibacterium sp. IMCC21224 TaxID=1618204 RepID=UPI00064DE163|nr:hypothetical protein [Puniceibacterium sp. IMCC21224]KMK67948.1 hypothetical protein IMCC21224_112825 [Puniceibacterium sp. IMCC21224]